MRLHTARSRLTRSFGLRDLLGACLLVAACADDADLGEATSSSDGAEAWDATDASVPAPPPPGWAAHDCEMPPPEGFTAADFRCGTLTVEADRDQPGAARLSIEAAVLRASGDAPSSEPLLFVGGGPGAPSLDGYLRTHADTVLAPIRADRDVVFFDQRGSGRSQPSLACPEHGVALQSALAEHLSTTEENEARLTGYRACYERLTSEGLDLDVYHSAAVAQDARELMLALGYDRYHVYGISYGGRIAQVMLRDTPEGIVSVVLDAAVVPEDHTAVSATQDGYGALQRFIASCLADGSCEAELEDQFYAGYAQLEETPFTTEMLTDDGTVTVVINGHRIVPVIQAMVGGTTGSFVPVLLAQLTEGNYGILQAVAERLATDRTGAGAGYLASVLCAEEIPFDDEAAVEEARADVPELLLEASVPLRGGLLLDLCEDWRVRARPELEQQPVRSDIPALILFGSLDAAVHPSAGERAHRNLGNSQLFTFAGVGHGVLRTEPGDPNAPSCAQQLTLAFLEDPGAPLDGACVPVDYQ